MQQPGQLPAIPQHCPRALDPPGLLVPAYRMPAPPGRPPPRPNRNACLSHDWCCPHLQGAIHPPQDQPQGKGAAADPNAQGSRCQHSPWTGHLIRTTGKPETLSTMLVFYFSVFFMVGSETCVFNLIYSLLWPVTLGRK